MQVIKKIGVLSAAKIGLLFGLLVGLVAGLFLAIVTTYIPEAVASMPTAYAALTGWKAIIIGPVFYGILYFFSGLIGAWVYNLFAKWIGGVSVELVGKK